jgi:hypothetical protein
VPVVLLLGSLLRGVVGPAEEVPGLGRGSGGGSRSPLAVAHDVLVRYLPDSEAFDVDMLVGVVTATVALHFLVQQRGRAAAGRAHAD